MPVQFQLVLTTLLSLSTYVTGDSTRIDAALRGAPFRNRKLAAQSVAEETRWPDRSDGACRGLGKASRSCRFRNIVYDTVDKRVVFIGSQQDVRTDTALGNLYITSGLAGALDQLEVVFSPGAPFPPRETACLEQAPMYFTHASDTALLEHAIRTSAQQVIASLRFQSFAPRVLLLDAAKAAREFAMYGEWLNSSSVLTWRELLARCDRRHVVFADIVAAADAEDAPEAAPSQPCDPARFVAMKASAYALAGIVPRRAHALPYFRVLFDLSSPDAGAPPLRLEGVPRVIEGLSDQFSDVDFRQVVLAQLSPEEQLRELAAASVYVAAARTAPLRMAYLPEGAHVIIFSTRSRSEGPGVLPPQPQGQPPYAISAYADVENCWRHIEYVRIVQYDDVVAEADSAEQGDDEEEGDEGTPRFSDEADLRSNNSDAEALQVLPFSSSIELAMVDILDHDDASSARFRLRSVHA